MSQKGGKRAYRSRLRKSQSACKSRHSVFSFRRDHVRLRSSPRRNATLSRHKAVRISSRCMRWVPRDVAAPGRSGQPLEQRASASWSVTKPSQPPADDCDWRLDLPRLQRRVPRAYANRTRVPRRDRGSDRERSSPQARAGAVGQRSCARASRCYRIASRRSRACSRGLWLSAPNRLQQSPVGRPRIDPAPRRARTCRDHLAGDLGVAITDRSSRSSFRTKAQRSPQWGARCSPPRPFRRMAVHGTTGCTAGRALTGASVALTSRVSWVRPCSSERYRPSSFVGARAAAPLMSRKGRMTCCSGWILSDSREQQLRAYRRSSIDAKNGTPRFLGRGFSLRYGMVLIQELRP